MQTKYKIKVFWLIILLVTPRVTSGLEEKNLKAYFIYQFTRYIQWPENIKINPLVIGIYGQSSITGPLEIIARETSVPAKEIRIKTLENLSDINGVHILFLPLDQSGNLSDILNQIGESSVVVVSEKPGLAKEGSCINFVDLKDNIGFEINLKSFKKANLYVSSRLSRLATEVYGE